MNPTETLRHERRLAGITQAAMAAQLGMSASFLCQIERGNAQLPEAFLPRLPDAVRPAVVRAVLRELEDRTVKLRQLLYVEVALQ